MGISKNMIQISDLMEDVEHAIEKAWLMGGDADQNYFSLSSTACIVHMYDAARVRNDILLDYLTEAKEKFKEVEAIFREEWADRKRESV